MDTAVHLAPGLVVADRFRLLSLIGQGGMGAVWAAHHIGLDVRCAVKFILAKASSPELRARFEREARAIAQIRSPHVVHTYDHGVWHGIPYIAMELLEGEDLAARLKRQRTLSPRETFVILAQVGRALAKAHAAGLVHRDLKPGNIYLVRDEENEIAKVLDFGVAKDNTLGTDSDTRTGALLGTPYYMSPEQARGNRDVDHRSDLWALGVIAYQCLTGQLPFVGTALGDLLMRIIVEPIPIPSTIAPVPPGFDAWWARAVARDPGQRFQSTKELTDALAEALGLGTRDAPPNMVTPQGAYQPWAGAPGMPAPTMPLPVDRPPSHPTTGGARLHVSTNGPQAISVGAPARSSRAAAVMVALVGVLALGGGGAFFAMRGPGAPAAQPAVSAPVEIALPKTAAPEIPTPTVAPVDPPAASATATSASAPASASAPPLPARPSRQPKGPLPPPASAPSAAPNKPPATAPPPAAPSPPKYEGVE